MLPAWIVDSGLLGLSWGGIPDLTSDWELRNSDFWLIQEHSISELITSLNSRQTSYSEDKEREIGLFIQGPRHRWRGLHEWKQSGQLVGSKWEAKRTRGMNETEPRSKVGTIQKTNAKHGDKKTHTKHKDWDEEHLRTDG